MTDRRRVEEIETLIEEVEIRLYNIKQEKYPVTMCTSSYFLDMIWSTKGGRYL